MKRLLLWLIGVALGVVVLLAAVLGVSYSFTSEGAKPASEVQFAGQELEPNGWCWQVPLLGGQVDKVFASPRTLTVQKLGVLYDAHPAFALPEWYSYGPLTITDSAGNVVFEGTAATYDDFLFPANGDYKAELTVWRLPENMLATQFEGGSTGELRQDVRLEKPAKPIGWYYYSFRFTLQASAEVELSSERMEQGGTVAAAFTGMVGETAPTVETDLGNVQAVRLGSGWRAYIPAAYNAAAGAHEVTFTVGGETVVKNITVIPKDFGTVEIEAEPEASEAANTEFRNAVWPLYEQPAREKLWSGGFACPAENYMTLVDFGQTKVTGGKQGSKSNSTKLYTIPGDPCRAPANGVVVLARNLALTGKVTMDTTYPEGSTRNTNPCFQPARRMQAIRLLDSWSDLCEKYHCTKAQLVIALTARMIPGLHVLCGARTPEQAIDNAGALHIALEGADAVQMKWDVDAIS